MQHVIIAAQMRGRCHDCVRGTPWFCVTTDLGRAKQRFRLADGRPGSAMVGKGTSAEEVVVFQDTAPPRHTRRQAMSNGTESGTAGVGQSSASGVLERVPAHWSLVVGRRRLHRHGRGLSVLRPARRARPLPVKARQPAPFRRDPCDCSGGPAGCPDAGTAAGSTWPVRTLGGRRRYVPPWTPPGSAGRWCSPASVGVAATSAAT